MSRYEIRERPVSDHVRNKSPEAPSVLYVVWDMVKLRRVPFGNYSNRQHAESRIKRLEGRHE